jgi:hypothetical protein
VNALVFKNVNNGVYRCGFASTQEAYEEAFLDLSGTLDQIEERLSRQRYLAGDRITEADWRLFTTLLRFDAVYYSHFKCNLRRIADYPNLSNYLRELYQVPGVAATVNMDHIKRHYYISMRNSIRAASCRSGRRWILQRSTIGGGSKLSSRPRAKPESRDPCVRTCVVARWIPARARCARLAGMTYSAVMPSFLISAPQ